MPAAIDYSAFSVEQLWAALKATKLSERASRNANVFNHLRAGNLHAVAGNLLAGAPREAHKRARCRIRRALRDVAATHP